MGDENKMKFTKENSPWLNAQRKLKSAILNCTWCEGQIEEQRPDYWECVACGKYHEV